MSIKDKKVGFLGAGNMGEAIIKGLLQTGLVPASSIAATDARADRLELAQELSRRAHSAERTLNILLQVNLGDEPQKGGVAPAETKRLGEAVAGLPGLRVRGLMAIPPAAPTPELTRPHFRALRELRDSLGLEHLSMGMSADYEVAIEEGATMVRVGTAIFGQRAPVAKEKS